MNFRMGFPVSENNAAGILIRIALNPQAVFGSTTTLTILSLT